MPNRRKFNWVQTNQATTTDDLYQPVVSDEEPVLIWGSMRETRIRERDEGGFIDLGIAEIKCFVREPVDKEDRLVLLDTTPQESYEVIDVQRYQNNRGRMLTLERSNA